MIKTAEDLLRLLRNDGRVDVSANHYAPQGYYISLRDSKDRSKGYVSLRALNALLRQVAVGPPTPRGRHEKNYNALAMELSHLKARVRALEEAPSTARKRRRTIRPQRSPEDALLDDIARGMAAGKAFHRLTPTEQDAVRQLAQRVAAEVS